MTYLDFFFGLKPDHLLHLCRWWSPGHFFLLPDLLALVVAVDNHGSNKQAANHTTDITHHMAGPLFN